MLVTSSSAARPTTPAIVARGVYKEFRLKRSGYAGVKGKLGELASVVRGRKLPPTEILSALTDINLSIGQGETVALVGRNGSGKSTLLSLFAHVMLPDHGEIAFPASQDPDHPRLAPLLEVGAGFHPDLTGIQNIYFNGSILGLTRAQMDGRIDAIKAFADFPPVRFPDGREDPDAYYEAPVRTYSSGMFARLGFAVAVHTDPEIVIVDETLAVGDEAFQEKCYRKISEFQQAGKTIVFVSHDMSAVRRVATRAVWLSKGVIEIDGTVETVIHAYHAATSIPDE